MKPIELTDAEHGLLRQLTFDIHSLPSSEAVRANGEIALALAKGLIERDGIPARRLKYLTEPSCNIGGHGKSRRQQFEQNGTRGDDIARHPHFLPFLRYFIYGADLPSAAIAEFEQAVAACGGVTSGDILPLAKLAKQLTERQGLEPRSASEEFFKLALGCGLSPSQAQPTRDAVRRAKRR